MQESRPRSAPLRLALRGAAHVIAQVIAGRSLDDALVRDAGARGPDAVALRAAVQDLAYSTLREFGRGDFMLARLMPRPAAQPQLRALLLAALARLESRADVHTTVDQAVAAAADIDRGRYKGLVNAVLRGYLRQRVQLRAAADADVVARWRHPRWWIARVQADHPQAWPAILDAGNAHPPLTLRVNCRRTTVGAYLASLAAAGIAANHLEGAAVQLERPVPVERLPGFAAGLVSVQDAGAQRAAPWLDLQPGQRVLDACAAPGSKTAHMLELADVDLLALDSAAARLPRIAQNLARLGLCARVAAADCREPAAWWDGRPFDRILADVPCSASGVVRRHPDIKWLRRARDVAAYAALQAQIVDALWQVLAPNGKLLYVTCSVFADENGCQVAAFAARHHDCQRVSVDGQLERQLLPRPEHDGFFYALLHKRP